MSLNSLLKFANITDVKRAIKDPKKAFRVAYRQALGRKSTTIDNSESLDAERIKALSHLFDVHPDTVEKHLSELRRSDLQNRLEECMRVMEDYPFGLGGMHVGGETVYIVAALLKPRAICEIGVANGVSTLYLLGAADYGNFDPDIRAIDKPQFESMIREQRGKRGLHGTGGIIPDTREAGWVAPKRQRAEYGYQYYVGDFTEILPDVMEEIEHLDLVLYDASKDRVEMEMAYEESISILEPGGVLISDDITVNNAFQTVTSQYDGTSFIFGGTGLFRKGNSIGNESKTSPTKY